MSHSPAASSSPAAPESQELVKSLGLFDSTMIVMGSMIGSGIFIVSADVARAVQSPGLLVLVWLLAGALTLTLALTYGELAAAMPKAGGQYVFLRESLGPLWGFLYGWTLLVVIQTATIAAVGIAFAKFTGVVFPWFSSTSWILKIGTFGPWHMWFGDLGPYNVGLNTQNLLAILSIVLLSWVNMRGVKTGAVVQNIFTVTKIAALALVIILGFVFATSQAHAVNFTDFWRNASLFAQKPFALGDRTVTVSVLSLIAVALVGPLFASDAWNNITFAASEVKKPQRTLPLALALGVGAVTIFYVVANLSYLNVLPLDGAGDGASPVLRGIAFAREDRVGTAVAEVVFGQSGAIIMALAIMFSTFGCNNGLILAGSRVYYAMAKDGLFFASVGTVNKHHTPAFALVVQAIWASLLCLSGTYGQLLDFIVFAVLVFYILTVVGLFVLRKKQPNLPRPYRAIGYPYLPILYIAVALFIEVELLIYKPQFTWPGLILVVLGAPVYWLWQRVTRRDSRKSMEHIDGESAIC